MKKFTILTFAALVYFITFTYATDPAEKSEENFDWLLEEVESLDREELFLGEIKTMIFIYDSEGNEITSFDEATYDTLPINIKRTMNKSEFLFETKGDKVYMVTK